MTTKRFHCHCRWCHRTFTGVTGTLHTFAIQRNALPVAMNEPVEAGLPEVWIELVTPATVTAIRSHSNLYARNKS